MGQHFTAEEARLVHAAAQGFLPVFQQDSFFLFYRIPFRSQFVIYLHIREQVLCLVYLYGKGTFLFQPVNPVCMVGRNDYPDFTALDLCQDRYCIKQHQQAGYPKKMILFHIVSV